MKLFGALMVLTAFLLPLKWGTLAAMTEAAGFFPANWSDYITITWAAHSCWIWSGMLLAAALFCLPGNFSWRSPVGIMALLWSVTVIIAALPGCFAPGRDVDFAVGEFSNIAGIAAWSLAVGRLRETAPRWLGRMAAALLAGTLIAAIYGYYQYFWGFEELKSFIAKQIADGINVPEAIRLKMADTRITSFLASPNALAGMILITLPLIFYFGRQWGMMFEPVKLSVPLFIVSGLVTVSGALVLCRSRSIVAVFVITGALALFSSPVKRRYKIAGILAALLLIAGGAFFAMRYGRGFGSMTERLDYLRTTVILNKEHPLTGAGWGGFFYRHMNVKFSSTDEAARDPHNILASFSGQCGIISALLVLAALLYPLMVLWKYRFEPGWRGAVFWSGVLFTLHALMDGDLHIPAIMAGMLLLYFSALPENPSAPAVSKKLIIPAFTVVALLAMVSNGWFLYGEIKLADFTDYLNPSDVASRARFAGQPMEKFENAASCARPHLALIPELAGDWFFRHGDLSSAEQRYFEALKLSSRRPGIYRRLARLACARGDFSSGAGLLKQAEKLFPRNPKYRLEHPENRVMFPADFTLKDLQ